MSTGSNRWIITTHSFYEHKTIGAAIAELARIKGQHPDKHFRMIRIKRTAHDSDCPANHVPAGRCDCPMGAYDAQVAAVAGEMAQS